MMDTDFFAGILIGVILSLLTVAIIKATNNQPQAIDVYRGKTTLQITYKDTIPQDTIVVFKN